MFGNSTLFTGGKGAGKTLHAVTFLYTEPKFKGRPLYVYGVKEFDCERFEKETGAPAEYLTQEQVLNWKQHVPKNAVIFIDEVQKLWRQRRTGSAVPIGVQDIEDSRHDGIDLVATCQFLVQLDTHFRYLVDRHIHLERKPGSFGKPRVKWFEWPKCKNLVDDYHHRKEATVSKVVKIQPDYFGTYLSADTHYDSAKIPKKLYYVLGLFAFCGFMLYYVFTSLFDSPDAATVVSNSDKSAVEKMTDNILGGVSMAQPTVSQGTILSSAQTYLESVTPVVKNQPNTAPIYADLHQPASMPRPNCLAKVSKGVTTCRCYSQQATRMAISERQCLHHVNNGYSFDYTRPDLDPDENSRQPLSVPYESDKPKNTKPPMVTSLSSLRTPPTTAKRPTF